MPRPASHPQPPLRSPPHHTHTHTPPFSLPGTPRIPETCPPPRNSGHPALSPPPAAAEPVPVRALTAVGAELPVPQVDPGEALARLAPALLQMPAAASAADAACLLLRALPLLPLPPACCWRCLCCLAAAAACSAAAPAMLPARCLDASAAGVTCPLLAPPLPPACRPAAHAAAASPATCNLSLMPPRPSPASPPRPRPYPLPALPAATLPPLTNVLGPLEADLLVEDYFIRWGWGGVGWGVVVVSCVYLCRVWHACFVVVVYVCVCVCVCVDLGRGTVWVDTALVV